MITRAAVAILDLWPPGCRWIWPSLVFVFRSLHRLRSILTIVWLQSSSWHIVQYFLVLFCIYSGCYRICSRFNSKRRLVTAVLFQTRLLETEAPPRKDVCILALAPRFPST